MAHLIIKPRFSDITYYRVTDIPVFRVEVPQNSQDIKNDSQHAKHIPCSAIFSL